MKTLAVLTLAAGLTVAAFPSPSGAETLRIMGDEAMGLTTTVTGDGSVTKVAIAAFDGLLADVEGSNRVLGRAQFTMTMVTSGDELRSARITYTQAGRRAQSVTITIDPCWLQLSNERDFTAEDFGADVREEIEEALPSGALDPTVSKWLEQRLALLAARIAVANLKAGVVLVPPRS
jgi:hypothetical protein